MYIIYIEYITGEDYVVNVFRENMKDRIHILTNYTGIIFYMNQTYNRSIQRVFVEQGLWQIASVQIDQRRRQHWPPLHLVGVHSHKRHVRLRRVRPVRMHRSGQPNGGLLLAARRHHRRPAAVLHVPRTAPELIASTLPVLHVPIAAIDEHIAAALRLAEGNRCQWRCIQRELVVVHEFVHGRLVGGDAGCRCCCC